MKKHERACYISAKLQELYPSIAVPLDHRDPYTLLVAVVLSAQCTDKRVNEVTPLLFAQADCPAEMACLRIAQIKKCIKSCKRSAPEAQDLR